MRLLLDTQILIWALTRPQRLTSSVYETLRSRDNDILFSAVTVWEVAIKFALRRPDFDVRPEALMAYAAEAEFRELPVTSSAAARVATLPLHHRDPFDRLLVAQAIDRDARLLTADAALSDYAPHILMAG